MNPTLEVQITAKLDKLDAGLKVAEAKVNQSAQTMSKAGEKASSNFGQSFAANLPAMMIATAIAHSVGNGILQAVKDSNAGKSGTEIGLGLAQGIVDGAKSLPVVGVIFGILDELVNGASAYIDKLNAGVAKAVETYISSMQEMTKATKDFKETTQQKVEDNTVYGSAENTARLASARENVKATAEAEALKERGQQALREKRKQQALEDAASMAAMQNEGISGDQIRASEGRISRDEEIVKNRKKAEGDMRRAAEAVAKNDAEIDAALIARKLANQDALNKKLKEMNDKADEYRKVDQEKAAAENKKNAIETGEEMIAIFKEQEKEKYKASMQAQQDIIDANKEAQAQIDKIGRVDQMAGQAAQGMISSGQTALGQFNFAQAGAGGTAMDMAKKQVASLEKIEAATAEQVRLSKENKGFQ
jgi:hypothetical protein